MESGLLSLKWNDHSHTFFDMLSTIRRKESYCDVTLVCDGRFYPVHKLVLSTCSDFFDNLFSRTDCKHPIVVIANVSHKEIEALLNYMYLGEVNVFQKELGNLMKAAEVLKIKGLADPIKCAAKDDKDKELLDSSTKRKRSEDSGAPLAKRSQCAERPGLKESNDLQTLSKDSELSNVLPKPSSSNTGASSDSKEPFIPSVFEQQGDREEDPIEKAVRPEVKVEEIRIKDEVGGWFDENDESGANIPYSESDSKTDYDNQTMDYSSPCVAWEYPPAAQSHLMESHLPQGMPGASGLQAKPLPKKWRKLGDEERAMLLTLARANPKASSEKLRCLLADFNIDISARTVRRELLDAGIKLPKQSTKPCNSVGESSQNQNVA